MKPFVDGDGCFGMHRALRTLRNKSFMHETLELLLVAVLERIRGFMHETFCCWTWLFWDASSS
jgi:hypothetical protein